MAKKSRTEKELLDLPMVGRCILSLQLGAAMNRNRARSYDVSTSANTSLNIGSAASASGVSAKMIRHYESIGLMPRPSRSQGNYRVYSDSDVQSLRFIRRARDLGFSMKQISTLMSLWRNRSRSSGMVRKLAMDHIVELQQKISELQGMVRTLEQLAQNCRGDSRPECPILDDFSDSPSANCHVRETKEARR